MSVDQESCKTDLTSKHLRSIFKAFTYQQPQIIYLRDGELVLYRRERSHRYQCRYKLPDGTWQRLSTGTLVLTRLSYVVE